jgi:hypothetical protein
MFISSSDCSDPFSKCFAILFAGINGTLLDIPWISGNPLDNRAIHQVNAGSHQFGRNGILTVSSQGGGET